MADQEEHTITTEELRQLATEFLNYTSMRPSTENGVRALAQAVLDLLNERERIDAKALEFESRWQHARRPPEVRSSER